MEGKYYGRVLGLGLPHDKNAAAKDEKILCIVVIYEKLLFLMLRLL
jgi:hypothetical protein